MPESRDERQRQAVLLAYQGEAMSTITARLGVTEAQVEKWLADMAAEAGSAPSPARPRRPVDRRPLAETLLKSGQLLSAGGPEEEDEEANVFIFFNDVAAHEFYDLVERSVDVLSAVEGVDRAWHADRELICVVGAVAPATLRDMLLRWWDEQLKGIIGRQ
jgi:transposase-like protein